MPQNTRKIAVTGIKNSFSVVLQEGTRKIDKKVRIWWVQDDLVCQLAVIIRIVGKRNEKSGAVSSQGLGGNLFGCSDSAYSLSGEAVVHERVQIFFRVKSCRGEFLEFTWNYLPEWVEFDFKITSGWISRSGDLQWIKLKVDIFSEGEVSWKVSVVLSGGWDLDLLRWKVEELTVYGEVDKEVRVILVAVLDFDVGWL